LPTYFSWIGPCLTFFIKAFPFRWIEKFHLLFLLVTCLLLLGSLFFGEGIKGAHRWLSLGMGIMALRIQPGEFFKIAFILSCSQFFTKGHLWAIKKKILFFSFNSLGLLILLKQPDFGTFFVTIMLFFLIWILSEYSKKLLWALIPLATLGILWALFSKVYRVERIIAFLNPWEHAKTRGFQIVQSFLALANGGLWGVGLGNGHEKLFYLPEAHNDFILSILGEELGLLGIITVGTLYFIFFISGHSLVKRIKNPTGQMFCAIFFILIMLQACLNMMVIMGLAPTKGMALPFISFGGSSLLANFLGLGLVFSALKDKNSVTSI